MSLQFEEETNVYDDCGNLLGQVDRPVEGCFPNFVTTGDAEFTLDELREIADHLESL